jgi:hypothetical protein
MVRLVSWKKSPYTGKEITINELRQRLEGIRIVVMPVHQSG